MDNLAKIDEMMALDSWEIKLIMLLEQDKITHAQFMIRVRKYAWTTLLSLNENQTSISFSTISFLLYESEICYPILKIEMGV